MADIRIATRKSPLAIKQATIIAEALSHLGHRSELCPISTKADEHLEKQLVDMGENKGLFTSALEQALLANEADIAVHSLKDMPTRLEEPLIIGAHFKRDDPRDAIVGITDVSSLPSNAVIGTGSPRRRALLLNHQSSWQMLPIRGNIHTRIKRLEQECDGVVLAVSGLERMHYQGDFCPLDPTWFVPSAGQGALAIECLVDSPWLKELSKINDEHTERCTQMERTLVNRLGAQCHAPVGAYVEHAQGQFTLHAYVGSDEGLFCRYRGANTNAEALVSMALGALEEDGVWNLLEK